MKSSTPSRVLAIASLIILFSCSNINNDLSKAHLKGEIKLLTEYTYSAIEIGKESLLLTSLKNRQ